MHLGERYRGGVSERSNASGVGVVVFGLLGLGMLLMVLKLTGYIAWSWWLVLLPIYGLLALVVAFLAFVAVVAFVLDRDRHDPGLGAKPPSGPFTGWKPQYATLP